MSIRLNKLRRKGDVEQQRKDTEQNQGQQASDKM